MHLFTRKNTDSIIIIISKYIIITVTVALFIIDAIPLIHVDEVFHAAVVNIHPC